MIAKYLKSGRKNISFIANDKRIKKMYRVELGRLRFSVKTSRFRRNTQAKARNYQVIFSFEAVSMPLLLRTF